MNPELFHIYGDATSCVADVIFVHGLDGDAYTTWGREKTALANSAPYWPQWLGQDIPDINVWSLNYDAASSGWHGSAMPLTDRAINILALFRTHKIGQKPIIFIVHSMGGLLVKQLLRTIRDMGVPADTPLASHVKGIFFLSTPHMGSAIASGADFLSGLVPILRANKPIEDLRHHAPALRDLNLWFRNNYDSFEMRIEVLYETQNTRGVRVVDETSADPGIPRVIPTPVDENHITISAPKSRNHLVYRLAVSFVQERVSAIREGTVKPLDPH